MTPVGLPHSEIAGSKRACRSPTHIAACHVLRRLSVPRHPPSTLSNLTIKCLDLMRSAVARSFQKRAPCISLSTSPYSIVKETSGVDALKTEQEDQEGRTIVTLASDAIPVDPGCDPSRPRFDPRRRMLLRKEVIQPQVLLQLPCYDFTPITDHTLGGCLLCRLAHRLLVQPTFVM
jgi:hypothetical protein